MIQINKLPGQRYLELGGGANPVLTPRCLGGEDICVDVRACYDQQGRQTVDFTCDFNEPLPLGSDEFDCVVSVFCLEHISYRKTKQFLSEIFRVLKHGGMTLLVIPNTAAQIEWAAKNQQGWDGRDFFESISGLLFGDQDYPENSHKAFFSPETIKSLLAGVGFTKIEVTPYGTRDTDMSVQAVKWTENIKPPEKKFMRSNPETRQIEQSDSLSGPWEPIPGEPTLPVPSGGTSRSSATFTQIDLSKPQPLLNRDGSLMTPQQKFDRFYFNGGGKVGGYLQFYRDFPSNEIVAQNVLKKLREINGRSVLELGCARGYVIKRIQDEALIACGMDVSHHAWMTRVCDGIIEHDICDTPWPWKEDEFDLVFSQCVLEHIPEEHLDNVIKEIRRVSRYDMHGVDFSGQPNPSDLTVITQHSREWWIKRFNNYSTVDLRSFEDMERGEFPPIVLHGDRRLKLNIGSFTTMYHYGWINIDVHDLQEFAQSNNYRYMKFDVRNGLPFSTGDVDVIHMSHFFEHLSYEDGVAFLRECRRVLNPEKGFMRIAVPDVGMLLSWANNSNGDIHEFDEINDKCAEAHTRAQKLWALLFEGHSASYDEESLLRTLRQNGFLATRAQFRQGGDGSEFSPESSYKIRKEILDMFPCLSLYVDAIPNNVRE